MLLRTFCLSVILLGCMISPVWSRGVLTIRLLNFENRKGRTYDGSCCDQTPQDGATCPDQCDYVMRLIVTGLGRANDHVFLFHRPLKYDANDISFQEEATDMVLTILFDEWPKLGHVKMNAFFYDYDDYDHNTLLVDWFENELTRTVNKGNYQRSTVQGNRQADKTSLEFEWSVHCFTKEDCLTPPPEWKSWPWDRKEDQTDSGVSFPRSTRPPTTSMSMPVDKVVAHQWTDGRWKMSSAAPSSSDIADSPAIVSHGHKGQEQHGMSKKQPVRKTSYSGYSVTEPSVINKNTDMKMNGHEPKSPFGSKSGTKISRGHPQSVSRTGVLPTEGVQLVGAETIHENKAEKTRFNNRYHGQSPYGRPTYAVRKNRPHRPRPSEQNHKNRKSQPKSNPIHGRDPAVGKASPTTKRSHISANMVTKSTESFRYVSMDTPASTMSTFSQVDVTVTPAAGNRGHKSASNHKTKESEGPPKRSTQKPRNQSQTTTKPNVSTRTNRNHPVKSNNDSPFRKDNTKVAGDKKGVPSKGNSNERTKPKETSGVKQDRRKSNIGVNLKSRYQLMTSQASDIMEKSREVFREQKRKNNDVKSDDSKDKSSKRKKPYTPWTRPTATYSRRDNVTPTRTTRVTEATSRVIRQRTTPKYTKKSGPSRKQTTVRNRVTFSPVKTTPKRVATKTRTTQSIAVQKKRGKVPSVKAPFKPHPTLRPSKGLPTIKTIKVNAPSVKTLQNSPDTTLQPTATEKTQWKPTTLVYAPSSQRSPFKRVTQRRQRVTTSKPLNREKANPRGSLNVDTSNVSLETNKKSSSRTTQHLPKNTARTESTTDGQSWTHFTRWWQRKQTTVTLPTARVIPAGVNEGQVLHIVDEYRRQKGKKNNKYRNKMVNKWRPQDTSARVNPFNSFKTEVPQTTPVTSSRTFRPISVTRTWQRRKPFTKKIENVNMHQNIRKKVTSAPKHVASTTEAQLQHSTKAKTWYTTTRKPIHITKAPIKNKILKSKHRNPFVKVTTSPSPQIKEKRTSVYARINPPKKSTIPPTKQIRFQNNQKSPSTIRTMTISTMKTKNKVMTSVNPKLKTKQVDSQRNPNRPHLKVTPSWRRPHKYRTTTRYNERMGTLSTPPVSEIRSFRDNIKTSLPSNNKVVTPPTTRTWRYVKKGDKSSGLTTNIWSGLMSTRIVTENNRVLPTDKTSIDLKSFPKQHIKEQQKKQSIKNKKTFVKNKIHKVKENTFPKHNGSPFDKESATRSWQRPKLSKSTTTTRPRPSSRGTNRFVRITTQAPTAKVTRWWERKKATTKNIEQQTTLKNSPRFVRVTTPHPSRGSTKQWTRNQRTTSKTPETSSRRQTKGILRVTSPAPMSRSTKWWERKKETTISSKNPEPSSRKNNGVVTVTQQTSPARSTRWWERKKEAKLSPTPNTSHRTTVNIQRVTQPTESTRVTRWWERKTQTTANPKMPKVTGKTPVNIVRVKKTTPSAKPTRWWNRKKGPTTAPSISDSLKPSINIVRATTQAPLDKSTKWWERKRTEGKTTRKVAPSRDTVNFKRVTTPTPSLNDRSTRWWERKRNTGAATHISRSDASTKPNVVLVRATTKSPVLRATRWWERKKATTTVSRKHSGSTTMATTTPPARSTRSWERKHLVKSTPSSSQSPSAGKDFKRISSTNSPRPTRWWQRKKKTDMPEQTSTIRGNSNKINYDTVTVPSATRRWQRPDNRKVPLMNDMDTEKRTTKSSRLNNPYNVRPTKSWQRRATTKATDQAVKAVNTGTTSKSGYRTLGRTRSWMRPGLTTPSSVNTSPFSTRRTHLNTNRFLTNMMSGNKLETQTSGSVTSDTKKRTNGIRKSTTSPFASISTSIPQSTASKSFQNGMKANNKKIHNSNTTPGSLKKSNLPPDVKSSVQTTKKTISKVLQTLMTKENANGSAIVRSPPPKTVSVTINTLSRSVVTPMVVNTKIMAEPNLKFRSTENVQSGEMRSTQTPNQGSISKGKKKGFNIFEFLPDVLNKMYKGEDLDDKNKASNSQITAAAGRNGPGPSFKSKPITTKSGGNRGKITTKLVHNSVTGTATVKSANGKAAITKGSQTTTVPSKNIKQKTSIATTKKARYTQKTQSTITTRRSPVHKTKASKTTKPTTKATTTKTTKVTAKSTKPTTIKTTQILKKILQGKKKTLKAKTTNKISTVSPVTTTTKTTKKSVPVAKNNKKKKTSDKNKQKNKKNQKPTASNKKPPKFHLPKVIKMKKLPKPTVIDFKPNKKQKKTKVEAKKKSPKPKVDDKKPSLKIPKKVKVIEVNEKVEAKDKVKVNAPNPTAMVVNSSSDSGPRVNVPKGGLFIPVPGPTKIVKVVTNQRDENGTLREEEVFVAVPSEAQHIGMKVKRLNIQTVFNRYWPAILGLTIGTAFLVAAVLTSVACRAQRLYIQRYRYNDQPQHLTEPPDTSEYSSSAASLVSDATRSSIRL